MPLFFVRKDGRRITVFFFQAEDGIRDYKVTGVQTCALPISRGQTRLYHRAHGPPDPRAQRVRRAHRGGPRASLPPAGPARGRGPQRAAPPRRQSVSGLARALDDPSRFRQESERRGAAAAPQTPRSAPQGRCQVIAVWMLYCLGIGLAFVIAGHALERGLHLAGRATRWAWVIAIVGSYLVPVAAWLRPDAFATFAAPIPVVAESRPSLPTSKTSTNLDQPPPLAFSLADLDRPLRWAWMIASLALILFVGVGARRLIALRRRWRPANVDGRNVLISPSVGPAVVGVWAPSVVLPEWALDVSPHERAMMFAHEE